jgi:hypothetical protein
MGFIAVGGAVEKVYRDLEGCGMTQTLEARQAYGFISYDILPWLSVNAGAGQAELKPVPTDGYEDAEDLWTVGAGLNLWEYDIKDPSFMACRLRVQAQLSYWDQDAEIAEQHTEWEEWRFATTVSAEFFTGPFGGDTTLHPYSIVFFVGPLLSEIDFESCAVLSPTLPDNSLHEDRTVGVLGGVDVKLAHNLSFGWEARAFEDVSHSFNVAFHF